MKHVRSIFLSDIHLGTKACQAERLLEFLEEHTADNIFLIGDVIDFWSMSRSMNWSKAQNQVVQKLLQRARTDTRVVLIPGNHDEMLRDYCGTVFLEIKVVHQLIHQAANGKRYLLIHGDQFDQVTQHHKWVAQLGDQAYNTLVRLNMWLSWARRKLGISGYWSLAGYAKRKVKKALNFIFDFEECAVQYARDHQVEGIICGHIHWATIREINGMEYVNCGDWVDSCTAIVEDHDGSLELIAWHQGTPAQVPAEDMVSAVKA